MSHANRGRTKRHSDNPTPAEIREAREAAGMTQQRAAELVYTSWKTWQKWEAEPSGDEHRRMPPVVWESFKAKVKALGILERGGEDAAALRATLRRLGLHIP